MNYQRHPVISKEATTLLGLQVVTIWQQSNAKVQPVTSGFVASQLVKGNRKPKAKRVAIIKFNIHT